MKIDNLREDEVVLLNSGQIVMVIKPIKSKKDIVLVDSLNSPPKEINADIITRKIDTKECWRILRNRFLEVIKEMRAVKANLETITENKTL